MGNDMLSLGLELDLQLFVRFVGPRQAAQDQLDVHELRQFDLR